MSFLKVIVPDASVILKWVLRDDETHREKALAILSGWLDGKYEIIVPSLWFYEAGNILTRRNLCMQELLWKNSCSMSSLR